MPAENRFSTVMQHKKYKRYRQQTQEKRGRSAVVLFFDKKDFPEPDIPLADPVNFRFPGTRPAADVLK